MISVEPKAFFLGEMQMNRSFTPSGGDRLPGLVQWLDHIGGAEAVACLDHVNGSDLEQLIELLARRCYRSFAPGLNPNVRKIRTDSAEYHANIANQKHGSVMAHGHVTYAFENVSRVFTHEVVRNSVGNDMSQESLRYVRLDDIKFWVPPIIANERRTLHDLDYQFQGGDVIDGSDYVPVVREITAVQIFKEVVEKCEWAQKMLARLYDIENIKDFDTKKKLTSAFRRVAPEGLATGIGMTFNIRSLRWIIEQRTAPAAEEEIRIVFGMVARDARARWPMVLGDFDEVDTGDGLIHYIPKNSKI